MFGQITEAEAAERNLINKYAYVYVEEDGRLVVRNHRAKLEWHPLNQLPVVCGHNNESRVLTWNQIK